MSRKAEDLVGQKFNKLTVIERAPNIGQCKSMPNGQVAYFCNCDCGKNNLIVRAHSLKGGYIKSCGCIMVENLVGQKFGKLIVTKQAENAYKTDKYPRGRVMWFCDCECGKKDALVFAGSLKSGAQQSCGCGSFEYENLVGHQFGLLTVIKKVENVNISQSKEHGHIAYSCNCECGKQNIIIRGAFLKDGHTKSCGCLNFEIEDLVGKKFGLLTVIERVENITRAFSERSRSKSEVAFKCKCECGKIIITKLSTLKSESIFSCGCTSFYNENLISNYLDKYNIHYIRRQKLKLLNNNYPNYIVDYLINSIIIEYNGGQHYQPVKFGKMSEEQAQFSFIKQIQRDTSLKQFCEDNNYLLLIIDGRKYNGSKLEKYLENEFIPQLLNIMNGDNK